MSEAAAPDRDLRLPAVDDQSVIRRAPSMMLAAEPGIDVVGQAADGIEAVEQALALRPDVVMMDLQMPRANGVVATREITANLPATRVVVPTTFDQDELVFEAIRAGAHAYLLKDASQDEVVETIRSVHRGESRLSPTIACKVLNLFRHIAGDASARGLTNLPATPKAAAAPTPKPPVDRPGDEALTDKEERVLDPIAQGLSNKQIAASVFLAAGTVKNCVSRIMDKLHTHSRIELAVRAMGCRG